MLGDSGIPFAYRGKTFESFDVSDDNRYGWECAVGWLAGFAGDFLFPRRGILLYGPTGVGKTHLACAVVDSVIRRHGVFALFLPTVRIPRSDTGALLDLVDPDQVPVLVLDDLGAEKLTDRARECLYVLIDGRLAAGAPMIVTTNYVPDELRTRLGEYGDRLLGRLREACEFVAVGGDDYRGRL